MVAKWYPRMLKNGISSRFHKHIGGLKHLICRSLNYDAFNYFLYAEILLSTIFLIKFKYMYK